MNILWMAWKDIEHPDAGGAEVVKSQICQRLARDGHTVIQLTAGFQGAAVEAKLDGGTVIRVGGRYTVYWHAKRYYQQRLKGWAAIVIDECNTIPFFANYYVAERSILFIHQLAREIWFFQMRWPMSQLGYFLEPIYLRLLSKSLVITVSNSTRAELMKYGYNNDFIKIIREGTGVPVLESTSFIEKFITPTLLYLGSLRAMKRPHHVIEAFIKAKSRIPELKLILAGSGKGAYFDELKNFVASSNYSDSITFTGRVSEKEKISLLNKAHLIAVTSVKEGWGLIVTEAAARGTPAVVYDVDGLRDSVRNGISGLVTPCTPADLAEGIIHLLEDTKFYNDCRLAGLEWCKELNFENSYLDFCEALGILAVSDQRI